MRHSIRTASADTAASSARPTLELIVTIIKQAQIGHHPQPCELRHTQRPHPPPHTHTAAAASHRLTITTTCSPHSHLVCDHAFQGFDLCCICGALLACCAVGQLSVGGKPPACNALMAQAWSCRLLHQNAGTTARGGTPLHVLHAACRLQACCLHGPCARWKRSWSSVMTHSTIGYWDPLILGHINLRGIVKTHCALLTTLSKHVVKQRTR